jgi:hypothetical protein
MNWRQLADKRVNPHPALGHLLNRWILYGQHKAKKRGAPEYQESGGCCPEETNDFHLSKSVRTALGKQGAKVAKQKRKAA